MFHRSPILSFAIELLLYCVELQRAPTSRTRKLSVLHLAQAVELVVKAALVEQNVPIYEKGNRTLNTHDAREKLAALWSQPLPMSARVELLIDERNAIQHRYGSVDDLALDYHLETALVFTREILREDFDVDLDALIRQALPVDVWSAVRFVNGDAAVASVVAPSDSLESDESLVAKLLGGFAVFERLLRERIATTNPAAEIRSALDVTMKFLSYAEADPHMLVVLPKVFTVRNSSAHGVGRLGEEDVGNALKTLDQVTSLLGKPEHAQALSLAVEAHLKGRRGLARESSPAKSSDVPSEKQPDEGSG